ncbi:MAG: component of SufBCD complex [Rhodobacteraceae bacterium CG17_big_fil_post_rev_8_21_14_2_50_63_15]|nr:component of SufBCD complex [Roseovarius sp.]PIV78933.1 MAG: component of SufBCD complex [Rhodobacteraceae bacterium CG17_big_fil_post_rev_8_21_14_2_50_63_15]
MTWYGTIFELIDMRSFSNLWYWIALAVTWSSASHWVLGVPWDMAMRARRGRSPQAAADFEDMVRINTNRLRFVARESGMLLAGLVAFVLTSLALLGFVYRNEFAQALFFLGLPLTLVGALSLHTAHVVRERGLAGVDLIRRLYWHRLITQIIGMVSIFVTVIWGMYQNITSQVLG